MINNHAALIHILKQAKRVKWKTCKLIFFLEYNKNVSFYIICLLFDFQLLKMKDNFKNAFAGDDSSGKFTFENYLHL